VAVTLWLVGCDADSPLPPSTPFELVHSQHPTDGETPKCSLGWWTAGRLVVDGDRGTSIIVEAGDIRPVGRRLPVLWWPKFTGRRVGSEVAILDPNGKVVAVTGRRYRINEGFPFEDAGFVACNAEVTAL